MRPVISEDLFLRALAVNLRELYPRALRVFKRYGEHHSWEVNNALLRAWDQKKLDIVLTELEANCAQILKSNGKSEQLAQELWDKINHRILKPPLN